jgi:hypothetical protein
MASTFKVLGQAAPAATTNTDVYTVPSSTSAVVSSITACARDLGARSRIAVRPAGATIANEHYVAYDVTVGASDSTTLTLGITLAATDVITVYASTANLTFSVFGSEIS